MAGRRTLDVRVLAADPRSLGGQGHGCQTLNKSNRQANEQWAVARVVHGAPAGQLRVQLSAADGRTWFVNLPVSQLPLDIQVSRSEFIAITSGQEFRRVDAGASAWLEVRAKIRVILNDSWDPIGTAVAVEYEYDAYISDLYEMISHGASKEDVAAYLLRVETESMCLKPGPAEKRERTAHRLFALNLPALPGGWPAA